MLIKFWYQPYLTRLHLCSTLEKKPHSAGILENTKCYRYYYIVVAGIDQFNVTLTTSRFERVKTPQSALPEYKVLGFCDPFLYHVLPFGLTSLLPSHVWEYLFQKC